MKIDVDPNSKYPYKAHGALRKQGRIRKSVPQLPLDTPLDAAKIRFVCISDTHNQLENILGKIPNGDVLLHCGDFTNSGSCQEVANFAAALDRLPHRTKVVIAGNHEFGLDDRAESSVAILRRNKELSQFDVTDMRQLLRGCTYLQDQALTVENYKIYGSPWHPMEGFPFYAERGQPILDKWNQIPEDTDILMTHTPPLGHGDFSHPKFEKGGGMCGCVDLLNTVEQRVRPLYHVFGHIHPRSGVTTNGATHFVNASICYTYDDPKYPPIIFDLPRRRS